MRSHMRVVGLLGFWLMTMTPLLFAQDANQAPANAESIIKTQTRLVLVDTVVTDKKGAYIRDLTAKDFRVWEDNKEQAITSFAFEEESTQGANAQKRYLVLFFDNSTMSISDQAQARQAAAKFIDANTAPNHAMAIVNFGGTLQVAQNFTADADRLKQVVSGLKVSTVSPNPEVATLGTPPLNSGFPSLGSAEADFGVHTAMLALRTLATDLATVPGG
jgi:VWFA-related protein